MTTSGRVLAVAVLGLLASGCAPPVTVSPDGGTPELDAGPAPLDAGPDAGPPDAGETPTDAGTVPDAGELPDAGPITTDAGPSSIDTPTITPGTGVYTSAQTVTLATTTALGPDQKQPDHRLSSDRG
jgi:hypothetical protein